MPSVAWPQAVRRKPSGWRRGGPVMGCARFAKVRTHEVWRAPQPKRRGMAWRHCPLGRDDSATRGGLADVETSGSPATAVPLAMWDSMQTPGTQMGETARMRCPPEDGWRAERCGHVQGRPSLMATWGRGSPKRHHTKEEAV